MKTLKHLFITIVILLFSMTVNAQDSYGVSAMDPACEGAAIAREQRYVEKVTTKGAIVNLNYLADGPVADGSQYVRATSHVLSVEPGQSITMTIKAADFSDGLKYCFAGGWLDLDGSGDFNHPGALEDDPLSERIFFIGTARSATPEFQNPGLTFTFNIPEHATLCDSRLRIVFLDAWSPVETILPVGLYKKSFTIDFTVKIVPKIVIDKIYYSITDTLNKTIAIVGNEIEQAASVNIPSQVSYNGVTYRVTRIGDSAFSGCTGLTSVTIPNSVTSIGSSAFAGCTGLKSIEIPSSVISIGNYAFSDCTSLTNITSNVATLPAISDNTFNNISSDAVLRYPAGSDYSSWEPYFALTEEFATLCYNVLSESDKTAEIAAAGKYAGDIVIPSTIDGYTITTIGASAFFNCIGLTSVVIPNSVTSIEYNAFHNCTSLTSITIPNSVINIGPVAFRDCTGLTSVTIPNSVTGIGDSAFNGCTELTSIEIPNSVTSIGYNAFYGTAWLNNQSDEVIYAGKVLYKYKGTISENTSITINEGTLGIADYAFNDCTSLTSVTIPNSVTNIGYSAFNGCTSLKELRIEDGDEALSLVYDSFSSLGTYEGLFYDCPLETLFLGRDLSYEGNSPFYNIKTLKNVTISNSVTSIGGSMFSGCTGITSIKIPNSVTSIGGSAFSGCTGLTSVKIPNSVTSIGSRVFSGCTGLTSVTIPNSVTSIEYYAFSGCSGLTSITIPNSVTSIGSSAFSGCTNLRVVINCSNLTFSIGSTNHGYVAYYANRIIDVQNCLIDGNFIFGTINGVNTLVGYYGDDTKLTLPADYKGGNYAICDYAFYNCSGLTSVTIDNGVTNIGDYALSGCSGLTSVTIGNGVTSIGSSVFSGCTGLTSVTIPNSVTSIGSSMFSGCSRLTSVTIPNSVTSIGSSMFSGCTGLTSVKIPNSVISIGSGAFSGCSGLTSVTIPNSVTSIGSSAFSGCSGLTSVTISNSVTSIGSSMFSGCTGLTSVTIPNSVTSIGSGAFDECTNLKELCIEDGGETLSLGCNYYNYSGTGEGLFYDSPLETLYLGRDLSYNTSYSYGYSPFYKIKTLKSVTIGNSVTSIGSGAFSDCSNLKKAIWLTNTPPTGYKNIGATINYVANDQYSGLSNVKVYPYLSSFFEVDGVKYVPVSPAERTCDAIDCVYDSTVVDINIEKTVLFKGIAMNVKQVMPYTFYANKNIKTIKVENDGIVGNYAFNGCTSLNSAIISNNGSAGDYAFNGCTSLATAIISNNGSIGNKAFRNCSSLVTATLGDSIASIGASAFYGCSKLSEIVIPDAVTAIGSEAFENCKSLETVKIGNGTKSIDIDAFRGCSALSSITLGDSVTTIGSDAFYACSSLTEIVIPQSVTKINSYAFDGCTALADVIIEDRTTALSLGSNGSSPLFSSCPLDSVYIGGKITYSTSSSYGYSPFYRNTSLRSVVITDTEEEVYDNEFYGCSNLKNVSIGNGVKKIGNWAFSGCSALDYFAFGKSVQSIGEEAFSDCNNVTKLISSASTPPVCGTQALDDINKWNCTLYVPAESYNAYLAAEQWKEFFFMESIATETYTVTYIVDNNVYHVDTYVLNDVIVPIEAPVKDNHIFSHWEALPETMPAKNIEVVAVYDPVFTEVTITINQYGSGTYCSEYALDFSDVEGLKAYAATGYNVNTGVVTLTRVQTAREGTGLFVKGDPGEYVVPIMESSDDYSLNMLVGTLETTVVNAVSDDGMYRNYKYTIKEGDSAPLFYQFEDNSSLSANRAYLQIPLSWVSSASKSIAVRFDDGETTDIDEIQGETGEESLIYDMQGRVVENPAKGIYLINGKKVFIR